MFYHIIAKKIRKAKKIKINKICEICNINPSTYWRWEKGEVTPTHNDIRILAIILDVPVQEISKLQDFQNNFSLSARKIELDNILHKYDFEPEDKSYLKDIKSLHTTILKENDYLQEQLNYYQYAFLKSPSLLYLKMKTNKGYVLVLASERFYQHFNLPRENINYFFNTYIPLEARIKIRDTESKALSNKIAVNNVKVKEHLYGLRVRTYKYDGVEYLVGHLVDKTDLEMIEHANYRIKIMELALDEIPETCYFSAKLNKNEYVFISKGVYDVLGLSESDLRKDTKLWCKYIHKDDHKRMLHYVNEANHKKPTIFKYNNPKKGLRVLKTHFNVRVIDKKDILFGYFADITDYIYKDLPDPANDK
ncbi:MAG: helix-turn-helix transcriptional regulator [bacterium]|nr:helix-turn-helix transcriptional regulator [bacterium]